MGICVELVQFDGLFDGKAIKPMDEGFIHRLVCFYAGCFVRMRSAAVKSRVIRDI